MKSLIVSTLCIVLIVVTWLGFSDHSNKLIDDLVSLAETELYISVQEEDWPAADQGLSTLLELWSAHRLQYLLFSQHDLLFDIDVTFSRVEAYVVARSRDQAMGEVLALKRQFLLLRQNESLNWGNLI